MWVNYSNNSSTITHSDGFGWVLWQDYEEYTQWKLESTLRRSEAREELRRERNRYYADEADDDEGLEFDD